MRIGHWEVSSIETGWFALDGGAMFGVVPRSLWEKEIPPDDCNRIGLAARAMLLVEANGPRRVLVDTGVGTDWSPKLADIYGVDHERWQLETSLAQHGLTPGEITDVILTHLHFDHAGGATQLVDGDQTPSFANARYWVQKRNLAWAEHPTDKDRASYLSSNWVALQREGVLELLDGPGEWAPGIELFLSEGHTTAMQLPIISGEEGKLIYCADMIPTSAHIRPPWVMAYDNQPLITIEEKKKILSRVAVEGWVLFFEHDPFGPAATVKHGAKTFEVAGRVDL